jgi:hypothetical protein
VRGYALHVKSFPHFLLNDQKKSAGNPKTGFRQQIFFDFLPSGFSIKLFSGKLLIHTKAVSLTAYID